MRSVVRTQDDLIAFIAKVTDKLGEDLGGKPYTVSIRRFHRPRTTAQNAKFHSMIHDIATHVGYERPDDIKDFVKAEYGWKRSVKIGHVVTDIPMSTTEYTVDQFGHMIDRLYQLGAELGVEWSNDE